MTMQRGNPGLMAPPRRVVALTIVFLWFAIGGIAHFVATDTFVRIVPAWVPYPLPTVLISGTLELLGAAGILWRRTRRAAGIGLASLTVAVTPANVAMLHDHADWPGIPLWMLVARLPLQVLLLATIVWSTGVYPSRPPGR